MNPGSHQLPEKVIQFGTGVLLRGLPDYFIDKANRNGIFNGSIVVVKSTKGSTQVFTDRQSRYSICVRGIQDGIIKEDNLENTAISRVLSAVDHWQQILEAGESPHICLIVSNTTEVGIQLVKEFLSDKVPESFPGKLTAVLYARFKRLADRSPRVIIVPTELIVDNGNLLKHYVVQLAEFNTLGDDFIAWLTTHTIFCNSLVDRIVTPPSDEVKRSFPSCDELTIQTEPYKLWAIQGDESVRSILEFCKADEDVVIAPSIEYYRERKLRLLNGTGTMMASLGYLLGKETTYACMTDPEMGKYTEQAMLNEVEPTLPERTRSDSIPFAHSVLERWRNPFIVHKLLSVTLQATAKMKMRNVPTFLHYSSQFGKPPDLLTKGFAAHLLFMRVVRQEGGTFFGKRGLSEYPIRDDHAENFKELWHGVNFDNRRKFRSAIAQATSDQHLWGEDLNKLPGFTHSVYIHAVELMQRISE